MINYFPDSFFQQGTTHEVCEDYALHGNGYAIISDGCSNGGGPRIDTDWGSRILCKAAEQHIDKFHEDTIRNFMEGVITTAQVQCRVFPFLNPNCLTATLGVVKLMDDRFLVGLFGDGVIGAHKRDGTWEVYSYSFEQASYYLKYDMVPGELQSYLNRFGNKAKVAAYKGKLGELAEEITEFEFNSANPAFLRAFSVADYDFAFVGSDGFTAFYMQDVTTTSKQNIPIGIQSILSVLLDMSPNMLKSSSFLRRQRMWAFKREVGNTFLKKRWLNSDDLSMAGISVQ
jgi:hypothetical protein